MLQIKQNPDVWLNGKVVISSAKVVGSILASAVGLFFEGKLFQICMAWVLMTFLLILSYSIFGGDF